MSKKEFVDNANTRPGEYRGVIKAISEKGFCPFCPENIEIHHKKPLDVRTYWIITENMWPYEMTEKHILLIHRNHLDHLNSMTVDSWIELLAIIKEMNTTLDISGGSFFMRFGDTKFTGASVSHLHCHLIQSNPNHEDYEVKKGLFVRLG
ncbi:MAG: HIT domain-containing protein [bacterium]|nr:HIT domain-containing protein [bacterium]